MEEMTPELRSQLELQGWQFTDLQPSTLRSEIDNLTERVVELERCIEFLTETIVEIKGML